MRGPTEQLSPGEGRARLGAFLALNAIVVVHLIELRLKVHEDVVYMALLFGLLIAGCLLVATTLVVGAPGRVRGAWLGAAGLTGAAIAGYIASRAIALPGMDGHVGDWLNPLGALSLLVEGLVLGLSIGQLWAPGERTVQRSRSRLLARLAAPLAVVVLLGIPAVAGAHGGEPRGLQDDSGPPAALTGWLTDVGVGATVLFSYWGVVALRRRTRPGAERPA